MDDYSCDIYSPEEEQKSYETGFKEKETIKIVNSPTITCNPIINVNTPKPETERNWLKFIGMAFVVILSIYSPSVLYPSIENSNEGFQENLVYEYSKDNITQAFQNLLIDNNSTENFLFLENATKVNNLELSKLALQKIKRIKEVIASKNKLNKEIEKFHR